MKFTKFESAFVRGCQWLVDEVRSRTDDTWCNTVAYINAASTISIPVATIVVKPFFPDSSWVALHGTVSVLAFTLVGSTLGMIAFKTVMASFPKNFFAENAELGPGIVIRSVYIFMAMMSFTYISEPSDVAFALVSSAVTYSIGMMIFTRDDGDAARRRREKRESADASAWAARGHA